MNHNVQEKKDYRIIRSVLYTGNPNSVTIQSKYKTGAWPLFLLKKIIIVRSVLYPDLIIQKQVVNIYMKPKCSLLDIIFRSGPNLVLEYGLNRVLDQNNKYTDPKYNLRNNKYVNQYLESDAFRIWISI